MDALKGDSAQYRKGAEYFANFRSVVNGKALFLLFIWEIEAIIFCDLQAFGDHYSCVIQEYADVHSIKEPKEELKKIHKKYSETDNPEIFKKLDPNKILANSSYFKIFLKKFDKIISN